MNDKTIKKIEELFKGTDLEDLDVSYCEAEQFGDFIENMETQINETEVIYYSRAMEYLSENDASLKESLSIAKEYGYEVENLSSEVLASILQQENMRNKLSELTKEIEEIFEENEESENG